MRLPVAQLFIVFLLTGTGIANHSIGISLLYNPFSIEKEIRDEMSWVWITGYYQYSFTQHVHLSGGFSMYDNNKAEAIMTQGVYREIVIPICVNWTLMANNAGFNFGCGIDCSIISKDDLRKFAVYPLFDIGYLWSIGNRLKIGILMRNIIDYHMLYIYRPTLGIEGKFDFGG